MWDFALQISYVSWCINQMLFTKIHLKHEKKKKTRKRNKSSLFLTHKITFPASFLLRILFIDSFLKKQTEKNISNLNFLLSLNSIRQISCFFLPIPNFMIIVRCQKNLQKTNNLNKIICLLIIQWHIWFFITLFQLFKIDNAEYKIVKLKSTDEWDNKAYHCSKFHSQAKKAKRNRARRRNSWKEKNNVEKCQNRKYKKQKQK